MSLSLRAAAGFVTLLLAAQANAQSEPKPRNFGVQFGAGGYRATGVRELIGKSGTYFGLHKAVSGIQAQLSGESGVATVDFDFLSGSRDGSSSTAFALTITERVSLRPNAGDATTPGVPYVGLGIGLGNASNKQKVRIQNGGEVAFRTLSESNLGIAFKVVLGVNVGSTAFLETGWYSYPKAQGFQPGAFCTSIGLRF